VSVPAIMAHCNRGAQTIPSRHGYRRPPESHPRGFPCLWRTRAGASPAPSDEASVPQLLRATRHAAFGEPHAALRLALARAQSDGTVRDALREALQRGVWSRVVRDELVSGGPSS
jgi:hypothetical protein